MGTTTVVVTQDNDGGSVSVNVRIACDHNDAEVDAEFCPVIAQNPGDIVLKFDRATWAAFRAYVDAILMTPR